MALVRTRTSFGGYNILDAPPRITVVQNAVVVGWALCDERLLLVPDSAFARKDFRGGHFGLSIIGAPTTARRMLPGGRSTSVAAA